MTDECSMCDEPTEEGLDLCIEHQKEDDQRIDYLYEEADKAFMGDI